MSTNDKIRRMVIPAHPPSLEGYGDHELGTIGTFQQGDFVPLDQLSSLPGAPIIDIRRTSISNKFRVLKGAANLVRATQNEIVLELPANSRVFVGEGILAQAISDLDKLAICLASLDQWEPESAIVTSTYTARTCLDLGPFQTDRSFRFVGSSTDIEEALRLRADAFLRLDRRDAGTKLELESRFAFLARRMVLDGSPEKNALPTDHVQQHYLIPVSSIVAEPKASIAGVREKIHIIQERAYLRAGIPPEAVPSLYQRRRQQLEQFEGQHENYVLGGLPLDEIDVAQDYLKSSLSQRYDRQPPTLLQDPFAFSWLQDTWRYYSEKFYDDETLDRQLVFATAPTGNFNAQAIVSTDQVGIILDDGLPNLGRFASKILGDILYNRKSDRTFELVPFSDVMTNLKEAPEPLIDLAQAILDYIVDGETPRNAAVVDNQRSSISNSIFFSFICFVIEHELHHVAVRRGAGNRERIEHAFALVENKIEALAREECAISIDDQMPFQRVFANHNEELEADIRGVNLVLVRARAEGTTWPSLDGALMFFHLADAIRTTLLTLLDRDRLKREEQFDGERLTLDAIIRLESHPYPRLRRAGAIHSLTTSSPQYGQLLLEADKRLDFIFKSVSDLIVASIPEYAKSTDVHSRWLRPARDQD